MGRPHMLLQLPETANALGASKAECMEVHMLPRIMIYASR
jgi:hypothetical protein